MPIEIERKFLTTTHAFQKEATNKVYIKQGFLNSQKERVVRVRIQDDTAFLTVKGPSTSSGLSRFEWEKEITVPEAKSLLDLCEPGVIEKFRYFVPMGEHVFEVDAFLGENTGLVIAEIELSSEDEKFTAPSWLGKEVTGVEKYYNSNLTKNPFSNWK